MSINVEDIVKQNLCTGCGVCVSESNQALEMTWDEYGFIVPKVIDGKKLNKQALRVCPFNTVPERAVEDEDKLATLYLSESTHFDEKIGRFENTYVGYSSDYRNTSSSGGIATYVFEELLERKIVDYLYVVKEVGGTYEYQLFQHIDDLKCISKTRYIPVTLEKLFTEIGKIDGKIAVSGVACFIKAIRLKQHYHPELKNKIPFLVGIICGGWKSRFFSDFLAQSSGVSGEYHDQEYRIKDPKSTASDYSFGAYDERDNFHQMKMSKVGDMWGTGLFKSKACDFCTDVLTELADISLGDAWLPEYRSDGLGNSVIVTRTKLADEIIQLGVNSGRLHVNPIAKERVIESQKSSFSHRQDGIKFRSKIANLSGLKTPFIRNRVRKAIPLTYMFVQFFRERTRKMSLVYWKQTENVYLFNKKMKLELGILYLVTRIYHKLRKL